MRTEPKPDVTLPLGDRPRRRGRARRAVLLFAIGALIAGAGLAAAGRLDGGGEVDASLLPGAPVADGEVEQLAHDFAEAYADENSAALGKLMTRDVERVVPGARQEGRAAVLAAYEAQFKDARTTGFELSELAATGGASGRASARYRATYRGDPDVTGSIVFDVLRDRGTPRIALISARQDTS